MNTAIHPLRRSFALLALSSAFVLPALTFAASPVAATPTLQPLADSATPLPLKATFHKSSKKSDDEGGGYTLRLRNTSDQSVTVTATIIVSVPVHNNPKVREEPAHEIKAGKGWTIKNLAAQDRVTVKADGYAPLELTVP
ncbi:MAG TPA: hypothetical protein VG710_08815 [Opitutus sp.]|nr:hypothetical protein [Opitutus sp.]